MAKRSGSFSSPRSASSAQTKRNASSSSSSSSSASTQSQLQKRHPEIHQGLVVAGLGKACEVAFEDRVVLCWPPGRLYLADRLARPVTGDRVLFSFQANGEGWIHEIEERRSLLLRRAPETGKELILAANVDQVVICMAAEDPPFRPGLVDRYLVLCESSAIRPLLVINKSDLLSVEAVELLLQPFVSLGYTCLATSITSPESIEALRKHLEGKASVFTGPSGVGKSSLVNTLDPSFGLRTGEVNPYTGKGCHTTTVSRLFPFLGGVLIDTPGIRELGLIRLRAEELPAAFPEIRSLEGECKFRNCQHIAEPHCAVKSAVQEGLIQERRYQSYLQLYNELLVDATDSSYHK